MSVPARKGLGRGLEVLEPRLDGDLVERRAVEEVVRGGALGALAEPGGRVGLRVEIDDERAGARLGEAGGEVHGGRRLADAALLVGEREDAAHAR